MDSGPTGMRRRRRQLLQVSFVIVALFAAGLASAGVVSGAGALAALSTATDTSSSDSTTTETTTTASDSTTAETMTTESTTDTSITPLPAGPPTIASDKEDYLPGETVTLTGANWIPAEIVHIVVNDDQGQSWSRSVEVVAGADGTVQDQFQLPNWFVALYRVTATGPLSGTATTTFTDGTVAARNATTTPVGVAITYKLEKYSNTGCTGTPANTNTFTRTGPASTGSGSSSIASGNVESVQVQVTSISGGLVFDKWHFVDGNTAGDGSFYSSDVSFCFATQNNTQRTFIAFIKVANRTPTANNDSYNATEDTTLTVPAPGVLGNDTDPDAGDSLTVAAGSPIDNVDHGTLTLNANGSFSYAPDANYCGPDSFTYKAKDSANAESNAATVSISVACVNDPPVAATDTASVAEDSATGVLVDVLANDSAGPANESGQTLSLDAITQPPAHGTAVIEAGKVRYTPTEANYNGPDSFQYRVCDNGTTNGAADPKCDVATVNVTVTPVNDAPVVTAGADQSGSENDMISVSATFTDVEAGDKHTCSINWGEGVPTSGTVIEPASATPGSCTGQHKYLDDNPTGTSADNYTVTITVTDDGTTNGSADPKSDSDTLNVRFSNVNPVITSVTGPSGPIAAGGSASVTTNYTDVGTQDTHTCRYTWDDGSESAASGSGSGTGSCTGTHTYGSAGVYTVGVTVTDDDTGSATSKYEFVVVYDPSAGFVTGGGWINSPVGAYAAEPSLTGRANFGFVSKYKKGASAPEGQTEFQFRAGDLNFHSETYQWLVVAGAKAQYKGTGKVNGESGYGFLVTATDGQQNGGGGVDKFRIKIWRIAGGAIVYDNNPGASEDIDSANPQAIGGGSIVIHSGK
jgi:VCBS repeat-containing protein